MRFTKYLLAVAIIGSLTAHAQSTRSVKDPYPEANPPAGVQPKRPANYKPYNYPLSPKQLLDKYGPAMEKQSQAAWVDIEKVNATGPYKNTYKSLGAHPCPEWFKDAKIGMFIDWGPWSVGGYSTLNKGASYPDWYEKYLYENKDIQQYHSKTWGADITSDDLINLLSDSNFNPDKFAKLAKECGFRYVVPFLKHHGGFSLWKSSFTLRNSMDWAFHRDFAVELSRACKKQGLKFGDYVSVGEWDYPAILPNGQVGSFGFNAKLKENLNINDAYFLSGKIPVKDYSRDYLIPSIKELIDKTKPDLIWYDGAWENTSNTWLTRDINAYYYNKALGNNQEVCICLLYTSPSPRDRG